MNNFDYIINYKFYGRRIIKEDALDDALGLTANEPQNKPTPENNQASADVQQPPTNQPLDVPTDMDNMEGLDQPLNTPPSPENTSPKEGAVELDVTQLVLKQQEISQTVTDMLAKLNQVLQVNDTTKAEFEKKLQDVKGEIARDNNEIKQEIQKRNPTPFEKMELRSMNSFPYNVKLSDFWVSTDQDKYRYAVTNSKENTPESPKEEEDKELVLKQSEVMNGYDEYKVKNSF